MVVIATLLNFVQEARSTKAADALKAMVSNTGDGKNPHRHRRPGQL
jgi:magnesium-transporting ATPase (P-type)